MTLRTTPSFSKHLPWWHSPPLRNPLNLFSWMHLVCTPQPWNVPIHTPLPPTLLRINTSRNRIRGDARLIAPRPPPTKDKSRRYYAHLASFCRQAPDERIAAVWRLAAQEYLDRIFQAAAASPVWFSTSGLGVAWLHLRLDAVPKYYTYLPYTHPRQEDE